MSREASIESTREAEPQLAVRTLFMLAALLVVGLFFALYGSLVAARSAFSPRAISRCCRSSWPAAGCSRSACCW